MEHVFGYFEFWDGMIGKYRARIHETGEYAEADTLDELREKVKESIKKYYVENPTYRSDVEKRFKYIRYVKVMI